MDSSAFGDHHVFNGRVIWNHPNPTRNRGMFARLRFGFLQLGFFR